jgi:hypothetical protein
MYLGLRECGCKSHCVASPPGVGGQACLCVPGPRSLPPPAPFSCRSPCSASSWPAIQPQPVVRDSPQQPPRAPEHQRSHLDGLGQLGGAVAVLDGSSTALRTHGHPRCEELRASWSILGDLFLEEVLGTLERRSDAALHAQPQEPPVSSRRGIPGRGCSGKRDVRRADR